MPDIFPLEDANAFGASIFTSKRERGIQTLSLKVLSTRIVIQSVLLYTRSEETTKVEGEKDGDGGSWGSLFRVCVRGDMMYACSSCDTRCSQDGKGIIEFERFFFLVWVPYHQRIRTLIQQNCSPERQHQVAKERNWLSSCSLCLKNDGNISTLRAHY